MKELRTSTTHFSHSWEGELISLPILVSWNSRLNLASLPLFANSNILERSREIIEKAFQKHKSEFEATKARDAALAAKKKAEAEKAKLAAEAAKKAPEAGPSFEEVTEEEAARIEA